MKFPLDLLDLFIPEIAHWMTGKSHSTKRRFQRAGQGLIAAGVTLSATAALFPDALVWAFNTAAWACFVAFLFTGCGAKLRLCLRADGTIKR